jgi:hypothetical protein
MKVPVCHCHLRERRCAASGSDVRLHHSYRLDALISAVRFTAITLGTFGGGQALWSWVVALPNPSMSRWRSPTGAA